MERTWFVVADQGKASLYKVEGTRLNPVLEEVDIIDHPEGREHGDPSSSGSNLSFSDLKGSTAEREKRFVRQVVDRLKKEQQTGSFRKLYVAAPAGFMGTLRGLYGSRLSQAVSGEYVGDYTHENARALSKRIKKKWSS